MNRFRVASIVVGVALVMAGCGGGSSDDPEQGGSAPDTEEAVVDETKQPAPAISEQDVASAFEQELGAKPDEDDIIVSTYPAPGASQPCSLMQVLETADEIETWSRPEFDEPVVTNPEGTVGVQILTLVPAEEENCIQAAEGVLEGF